MEPIMFTHTAPGRFNGMDVQIVDAQKQARTARDVRGPWVRPKVPSKTAGRRGPRRTWKRRNAPHYVWHYREPDDVLVIHGRTIIATPLQWDALSKATSQRAWDTRPGSMW
jgi:hypothetical protein